MPLSGPAHNAGVLVRPKALFELLNPSAKVGTPAILLQEYQWAYSGRQAAARSKNVQDGCACMVQAVLACKRHSLFLRIEGMIMLAATLHPDSTSLDIPEAILIFTLG
jgi:hypothetical protein